MWNSFGVDVLSLKRETMMCRLYAFGAWLTGSMALALMAVSLVLVPQSGAFADGPDTVYYCLGDATCSVNCTGAGACEGKLCNATYGNLNYGTTCGDCTCVRVDLGDGYKCHCILVNGP